MLIRKPQVISGGWGDSHPLHPPPRSAPELGDGEGEVSKFFFQNNIREELFLFSRFLFYLPRHLAEFGARWLLWLLRYDVLLKRGQDILRFVVCLFILPFEQKKPINYPRK